MVLGLARNGDSIFLISKIQYTYLDNAVCLVYDLPHPPTHVS